MAVARVAARLLAPALLAALLAAPARAQDTRLTSAWQDPGLTLIDLLDAGTRFYKQSALGEVVLDAQAPSGGEGSLRLAIAGADGQLNLRSDLETPIDLSDQNLVIWLRVEDPADLGYVALYIGHDELESHASYIISIGDDDPSMILGRAGEWHAVSVNLADPYRTAGRPDMSRVDALQLAVAAKGDDEAVVHVHGIASFPRPERGSVTLIFDDARDGVALAVPVLQRLGLRSSIAVITEFLDQAAFMSTAELVALERYLRWELLSHHTSEVPLDRSFDTYEPADLVAEFEALTARMLSLTSSPGWHHLVYPNGRIDQEAIETVRQYFTSGRTTVNQLGLETWPPGDPYRLRAMSVLATDAPEALIDLIDRAATSGGWLILAFHQITDAVIEHPTEYRLDDFKRVVEYLADADVDVLLLSDRWPEPP